MTHSLTAARKDCRPNDQSTGWRPAPGAEPRRRWLVLDMLSFALSAYSIAGVLGGTTENAFIAPSDQLLWIALPFGVLGALFTTRHVLARRRLVR